MDEEITALAQILGHVEDGGLEALRALCHPARLEVAGWLKAGVAPEDCGGAFPLAAAWVALAELAAGQDGRRGGVRPDEGRAGCRRAAGCAQAPGQTGDAALYSG